MFSSSSSSSSYKTVCVLLCLVLERNAPQAANVNGQKLNELLDGRRFEPVRQTLFSDPRERITFKCATVSVRTAQRRKMDEIYQKTVVCGDALTLSGSTRPCAASTTSTRRKRGRTLASFTLLVRLSRTHGALALCPVSVSTLPLQRRSG